VRVMPIVVLRIVVWGEVYHAISARSTRFEICLLMLRMSESSYNYHNTLTHVLSRLKRQTGSYSLVAWC
jgi:hypothetical protein